MCSHESLWLFVLAQILTTLGAVLIGVAYMKLRADWEKAVTLLGHLERELTKIRS